MQSIVHVELELRQFQSSPAFEHGIGDPSAVSAKRLLRELGGVTANNFHCVVCYMSFPVVDQVALVVP